MEWKSSGAILRYDGALFIEVPPALDDHTVTLFKNAAEPFREFHKKKITSENVLSYCHALYALCESADDDNRGVIFKIFEAINLASPNEDIRKLIAEAASSLPLKGNNTEQELITNLKHLPPKLWEENKRDEVIEELKTSDAFWGGVLGETEQQFESWFLSAAFQMIFRQDRVLPEDVYNITKDYFPDRVDRHSFEFLIASIIAGNLENIVLHAFTATKDSFVAAHLVDLVFAIDCLGKEGIPSMGFLAANRSLAIRRYAEKLLENSSLCETAEIYLDSIRIKTPKESDDTQPQTSTKKVIMDALGTSDAKIQLNLNIQKCNRVERKQIAQRLTVDDLKSMELDPKTNILLLEATNDEKDKESIVLESVLKEIEDSCCVPEYRFE